MASFIWDGATATRPVSPVPNPPWVSPLVAKFELLADGQIETVGTDSQLMVYNTPLATDSHYIETVFGQQGSTTADKVLLVAMPASALTATSMTDVSGYELRREGDEIRLRKRSGGVSTTLVTKVVTWSSGKVYRLLVKYDASNNTNTLEAYIIGVLELTYVDATPLKGQRYVGLNALGHQSQRFGPVFSGADVAATVPAGPTLSYTRTTSSKIDSTASSAGTTLTRTSPQVVTVTESPTGVYNVQHPEPFTDPMVFTLSATSDGQTTNETITISPTQTAAVNSGERLVYIDGAWV